MEILVGQIWVFDDMDRYVIREVHGSHCTLSHVDHQRDTVDYEQSWLAEGSRWRLEEAMDFAGKEMTREFFWNNYMNYPDGTRRLVAFRPGLDDGDWSPETPVEARAPFSTSDGIMDDESETNPATDLKIWLPSSVDEDFNLVLSLCSDGFHRPVLDLDFPYESLSWRRSSNRLRTYIQSGGSQIEFSIPLPDEGETGILKSSSGHVHVFMGKRLTWPAYQTLLDSVPGDDAAKFAGVTSFMGFGSLRAPWIVKPGTTGGGMTIPATIPVEIPRGFILGSAESVLAGTNVDLYDAFLWDCTPQGARYWERRAEGQTPLSDADRKYIQSLIDAYVRVITDDDFDDPILYDDKDEDEF